jgi:ubiquinone/menaquinone biosynthesis C-methylase UbiE
MTNTMHVESEYGRIADRYDHTWRGYLKSTHSAAIRLAEIEPSDRILDASGGTGILAEQVYGKLNSKGSLTLVDISNSMLELARKRLSPVDDVRMLTADVHDLGLDSGSFTKVLSVSAFHHYANPQKALSEFHRVLKTNGSLVIVDWCRDNLHFRAFNSFLQWTNRSHFQIYTMQEMKKMLMRQGFEIAERRKWSHGLWSLMGIRATKG